MAYSDIALLLALTLTVALAYPAKDDEAYYNKLHDYQESYGKDVRNLDGIDARDEARPLFSLLSRTNQAADSERGPNLKFDFGSSSHLDGIGGGHLVRELELQQGGGNLLRDLDMLRNRAAYLSREQRTPSNYDPILGSWSFPGSSKRSGCCDSLSGIGIGNQKRNMDEIDRSSFNSFIKKNFDEIDRSGFGSFVKRNFDEIDRSGFGSFVKRSAAPAAAPVEASHN